MERKNTDKDVAVISESSDWFGFVINMLQINLEKFCLCETQQKYNKSLAWAHEKLENKGGTFNQHLELVVAGIYRL